MQARGARASETYAEPDPDLLVTTKQPGILSCPHCDGRVVVVVEAATAPTDERE